MSAMSSLPDEDFSLLMAFNEEEESVGLLLDTESGSYVRGDNHWHTLSPENTVFNDTEVIEVEEDFLPLFDRFEKKGAEISYKQAQVYAVEEENTE